MSKKKGVLLGCGYILMTPKGHRNLPAEVDLFQWEQKCSNSHVIDFILIFLISFSLVRVLNIIGENLPFIRLVNTDVAC